VNASAVPASTCRACAHEPLSPVLSLGRTPLANRLLAQADLAREEPLYPLDLAYCGGCSLLQITQTVPPGELFSDYVYFSSFSESMLAHARDLAHRTKGERNLGKGSLVVEIASNDGYLLQYYKELGIDVLGIEPARNIAKVARERGIPTLTEFFGKELGQRLAHEGRSATVVHANNVMAHVPDINGFAAGLFAILTQEGVALIEVPYAREMIDRCEFDTIYHEHVFYFSLTALSKLFPRHGLKVVDVEVIPLHGGSLLVHVARQDSRAAVSQRVEVMLEEEGRIGMRAFRYYDSFSRRVHSLREELRGVLFDLKAKGARLVAYGAAAKGSTLLNYTAIGRETLDFVVDRSPHKQGSFMPGVHLPIRPTSALAEEMPDYVLLLTWNFKDEILAQQEAFRRKGSRFIIPLPSVSIV
jgi:SAM-dependent methyltransferase